MSELKNRIDFVYIFDVQDGNPNGDPDAGWYNEWWNATFPAFVEDGEQLPILNRNGYVFGGWYYGNETGYYRVAAKRADTGYDSNEGHNHIWARWLELCLQADRQA